MTIVSSCIARIVNSAKGKVHVQAISLDFGKYISSYPNFPKLEVLFLDLSPVLASADRDSANNWI